MYTENMNFFMNQAQFDRSKETACFLVARTRLFQRSRFFHRESAHARQSISLTAVYTLLASN
jgi:hypothetical protein